MMNASSSNFSFTSRVCTQLVVLDLFVVVSTIHSAVAPLQSRCDIIEPNGVRRALAANVFWTNATAV